MQTIRVKITKAAGHGHADTLHPTRRGACDAVAALARATGAWAFGRARRELCRILESTGPIDTRCWFVDPASGQAFGFEISAP